MTQYASPNSDNVDGSWSNAGGGQGALNSNIRKDGVDVDDTYIISEELFGSTDTCVFEIQNGDDPASDSDHIVRYRAMATAGFGSPVTLTVALYQDSLAPELNPVWTNTNNSVSVAGFTNYSFTLDDDEAEKITDYDDLQLWFIRGAGSMGDAMQVSEAYFEYPDGSTPAAPAAVAKDQPEAFILFID